MKKILFLGNSFTYYYDLPAKVEELGGGELECHSITRGGAYLNAYKAPSDELRIKLDKLLADNDYDYVVLQEQSLNPIVNFEDYISSVKQIKALVGKAKLLIYQTWSYADGSAILNSAGMSYAQMTDKLEAAAMQAADEIDAEVIPVGRVFYDALKNNAGAELYDADGLHPSEAGSRLAAKLFAEYLCK